MQQSAEKSGKEDVNQAAKQAGAGDPAQKQRAKEDLKDIAQNAKDPAVRKQAEDALKESPRTPRPKTSPAPPRSCKSG